MIDGVRFKVCGLTSLVDAECADRLGADYLGFNLYPKSPRHVTLPQFSAMASKLPERKKVAVMVEPTIDELTQAVAARFEYFQLHFAADTPLEQVEAWAAIVGAGRLWLAPKLPPESEVAEAWLPHAGTFMLDTFHASVYGGSGRTGDWAKFSRHQSLYPQRTWILAGGLNAENIGDALLKSGARFVDVNSGVEVAPGVKDEQRLRSFAVALSEARKRVGA